MKKRKTKKKLNPAEELKQSLPPVTNWNTTDEHEVKRAGSPDCGNHQNNIFPISLNIARPLKPYGSSL